MRSTEKQAFASTIGSLFFMLAGLFIEWLQLPFAPILFFLAIIIGGWKQTFEGIQELIHEKHLSVDLLMALAAIGACIIGNWFEGAMLTFIFCLSGTLEEYTTNKSKKEITSLMALKPTKALKITSDGQKTEVAVEELAINDHVLVPRGTTVPIDGEIIQGESSLDEATISGEAVPVDKKTGDQVFGGTLNVGHAFTMKVTQTSDQTLFAKIIHLIEEAQAVPTQTASFISRFENLYVKIVLIAVPLLILLPYLFLGWSFEESFYRGMVMLVVASPCAVVASATPATLAAISNAAKNGVLFKGGIHLELFTQLKAVAFDKTGTLTEGKPVVTDWLFLQKEQEVKNMLLAMEQQSAHPLAEAVLRFFNDPIPNELQHLLVKEVPGKGLESHYQGNDWTIGKHAYQPEKQTINPKTTKFIETILAEGKTAIYIAKNQELVGILALLDVPKPEAQSLIRYLHQEGIHTTMITGDNFGTAKAIAEQIGIETYYADCLPEDKTRLIQEQKNQYQINAMVGDGINDAPALATASIGIAMGEGTDIAMDVADIVLMKNDLEKLQFSHVLSKKLRRIIIQNLVFSISVIFLLLLSNFFQMISLPLGVIGHEGSTILVILNGLRLLRPIKISTDQNQPLVKNSIGNYPRNQFQKLT